MGNFNANNSYSIVTETELATVLAHYSSEFVLSVVEEAMRKRFMELPIIPLPNAANALEANFKAILEKYSDLPEAREEVFRVRNETHREIINAICKEFGLVLTVDETTVDIFSAASIMYDFFVSNFNTNMVTFFSNYIYNERNNIYESMGLSEFKKNKDSTTVYGKKVFKDIKLAVINANIDFVINQICGFDIPLSMIISMVKQPYDVAFLNGIINFNNDFFKNAYVRILNTSVRAEIITAIKFKLIEYGQYEN